LLSSVFTSHCLGISVAAVFVSSSSGLRYVTDFVVQIWLDEWFNWCLLPIKTRLSDIILFSCRQTDGSPKPFNDTGILPTSALTKSARSIHRKYRSTFPWCVSKHQATGTPAYTRVTTQSSLSTNWKIYWLHQLRSAFSLFVLKIKNQDGVTFVLITVQSEQLLCKFLSLRWRPHQHRLPREWQ
jgi:hypothetical protein